MHHILDGTSYLFGETNIIMVAVDGSEGSNRAVLIALELAEITKSKLLITHIINLGKIQHLATMSNKDMLDILNQYTDNANHLLSKHEEEAKEYKIEAESILDKGLPSDKIVHLASEREVDMIIMGYYGATGSKAGVGSATERVVQNSHCAVLVVK
jgi:nucleotide-binding universal stress UspA family protein